MPIGEQYTGDFPTGQFVGANQWWNTACSFEIEANVIAKWPAHIPCPEWLKAGDKRNLFYRYLEGGHLDKAWLALNSSQWFIKDAKEAMKELAKQMGDPAFELLAEAWTGTIDDRAGGY